MTTELHTDGYPKNWTEMPHWVVMVTDSPGEEHCAGHHPTRALADEQAQRLPKGSPFPKVYVKRTDVTTTRTEEP